MTVPSRLSVISGWADFPEGIRTSPVREEQREALEPRVKKVPTAGGETLWFCCVVSPVISPLRKENGITMSKGLKPLPFMLLLIGSYLSDVTLRGTDEHDERSAQLVVQLRKGHAAAAATAALHASPVLGGSSAKWKREDDDGDDKDEEDEDDAGVTGAGAAVQSALRRRRRLPQAP